MKHAKVQRFTHNFIIYEGHAMPEKYVGNLFGIEPLQGRVVEAEITARGSTFETVDLGYPVTTSDTWFTPVDIKLGPDGGIYVCDWYDDNVSHLEASVGKTDTGDGRIYRLIGKNAPPVQKFDMSKEKTIEVAKYLKHPNRWFRQTALRILGDRQDRSILPTLKQWFSNDAGQLSLDSFWAIYQIRGQTGINEIGAFTHKNPHVRRWAFRLSCDQGNLSRDLTKNLETFIRNEKDVETRTQIASSAKRLSPAACFRVLKELLKHETDTNDPYQPLLIWWALESKCNAPSQVIDFINSTQHFWTNRIVEDHLATRLVKRFTMPGTRQDFLILAQLFENARNANKELSQKMLAEFESTTRNFANLVFPNELLKVITEMGGASLELQVRQNDKPSIQAALAKLTDDKTHALEKEKLIRALGDIRAKDSVGLIVDQMKKSDNSKLQIACLESLQKFDADSVGNSIVERLPTLADDSALVAQSILASRKSWSLAVLEAIDAQKVNVKSIVQSTPRRMLFHGDKEIDSMVTRLFGNIAGATDAVLRQKIDKYFGELNSGNGSPYEGKKLFVANCGKCHRLYQNGGNIGPDLTSYQRNDLKMMLLHVVNPNAEIREGFENTMVSLDDGRIVSGFVKEQDNKQIVLRTAEGGDVRIDIESIENRKAVSQSLMPTGLLDELTVQQRRDLFAFLRSTQPLNN